MAERIDPWDQFFDVQDAAAQKIDTVMGEALDDKPRPFKVAVWAAIIEHFAERMRLDIDLPDLDQHAPAPTPDSAGAP